jgi:hypothetical protein
MPRQKESPSPDFTMDELLDLLPEFSTDSSGMTSEEIAEQKGMSVHWVHKVLGKVAKTGRLRVGHKRTVKIDGTACQKPAYSIVKEKG